MADIDYAKLNRQQKLAIFLICIGPEAAAEVLKQFDDATIELLCREMSTFPIVTQAVQKQVMEEFSSVVSQSFTSALGGLSYATRPRRSSIASARSAPPSMSSRTSARWRDARSSIS